MTGRIHSFQSLGAVDGPGLRFVIFLQGCPLRCMYCHNPDTWDPKGGTEYTVEDVVARVLRYRTYFGIDGGVTVSGGEAMLQWRFVAAFTRKASTPAWTPPASVLRTARRSTQCSRSPIW